MSSWQVITTLILSLFHYTHSVDVAESNTGSLLTFPDAPRNSPLFNKTYEVAPAQFGFQQYGGTLRGMLVLPANESYHKECPELQEPQGLNPYIHYINDWFIEEDDVTDFILVIDRLDCYFVDKIEYAQTLGASGVIMCDWKKEKLFTMWMPQDWSDDITIPAVLLQKKNCEDLMEHLGVTGWDPSNIENTRYPHPDDINWTLAEIEWGLPHDDDRVEWELWTSSNDHLGTEFKHNFNTTAILLDKANDTIFTPHQYILNGSHWGCPDSDLPCKKQCTNSGRYCAVDPEYDLSVGLDGMDVIQENLRSLCVWEYDKEQKGKMDDVMWWDYSVLWDENCGVYSDDKTMSFNANCSFTQMNNLDKSGNLSRFVEQCITDSGGYGYKDGKNTILHRETLLKYNSSIFTIPLIQVNEFLIHGNIDCAPPVTQQSCTVLSAICSGFIDGTQPEVCSYTPSPTMLNCTDDERDCNGECFGNHLLDACNECLLVSSHDWNKCIGCNGQINTTFDCAGTCGGHFSVNDCGYCKDTRLSGWEQFGVDCMGGCSTTLKEDECGQCITESDPSWNACVGCDNKPNSGMAFNPCGRCIASNQSDFSSFGKDCSGQCDGGHVMDECDQCLSSSDPQRNACLGCDGVPHSGKKMNECGYCIDGNDTHFDEYGLDCKGNCASEEVEVYYVDECGQCLLRSDPLFDDCCGGDIHKQINPCGLCLYRNMSTFDHAGKDCQGNCMGSYVVDACGECLDPTSDAFNSCMSCGDDEDSDLTYDCNDVCGGNWAINTCGECIDSDRPDFESYGKDCLGICGGSASYDRCGRCLNSTDQSRDSCVGCDNVAYSNMTLNPCSFCIDKYRSDFSTYGEDCSGECQGDHKTDRCGQCLLESDKEWNSCVGCDDVVNSNKLENECGECVDQDDEDFEDYGRDCSGECAPSPLTTHYVDECGNCLYRTDWDWNNCVKDDNGNSNGGSSDNGSDNGSDSQNSGDGLQSDGETRNLYMVIIGGSVLALICICCAVFGFGFLCKKNKEMRETVQQIQEMYAPMQDLGDSKQAIQRRVSRDDGDKGQGATAGDGNVLL